MRPIGRSVRGNWGKQLLCEECASAGFEPVETLSISNMGAGGTHFRRCNCEGPRSIGTAALAPPPYRGLARI